MVLMLQEADDPDAKLTLSTNSPSVNRLTIDENNEDTSEDGDRETTVLISQDPPPSYTDVQGFRQKVKVEEEIQAVYRTRRRFGLAIVIALLLVTLPVITGFILHLFFSLQDEIPQGREPTPTPTTSSSSPPFPPPPPPWRGRPEPGGPGGGPPSGPDRGGPPPWFPDEGRQWPGKGRRPEHPPPEDSEGDVICSGWIPHTHVVAEDEPSFRVAYSVPLNASISIRSFLSEAVGTLRISLDETLQPDLASIQVIARGIASSKVNDIAACLSTMTGRSSNLSLKARGSSAELATYSILLRLPASESSYPGLTTNLPRFIQSFDDLRQAQFAFVDVGGMESDVSSLFLFARFLNVRTSNGSIDGHFFADRRLDISGSFKPITITSTICDDGQGFPTFARINSLQSPINAKLTLCDTARGRSPKTDDDEYGRYRVYVANSDSPISLEVRHAIPAQGSSLYLNVTNTEPVLPSTAHTMVTLDTGFEGNFDIRAAGEGTTPVSVQSDDATDDQGGIRYVDIQNVGNNDRAISGKVFWDSPAPPLDRRASDVWISTSGDGEASLMLLGD